eukprot:CAMPEP_0113616748 /NCGR_PEP_ID=MMETSP0017_2-20120614/8406_1 /TAXON_ID=2856 /ORGANISM="Cylindrotheca closterium" /LENGTH=634 /DNA_ID=CAMNT_0000526085 /DNA_START=71 /DNA_END=1975 /DNA_ORIENTATION=+ /assembly_acc=CAM_ASM_000147
MEALTTMEAPLNEIEEESPPFALDESTTTEKEQPTLENLFSSPTSSSVASAQPIITSSQLVTSQSQSQAPIPQHQQQVLGSNSRILETPPAGIPTNTCLLTTTPTLDNNFTKFASDSSLLISSSQHDTDSTTTNSTSSMNSSSGSNASSGSSSQLPLAESSTSDTTSTTTEASFSSSQEHGMRMQASSTIMASSLFTVPLNSDSTMSLQNSRHNLVVGMSGSSGSSGSSSSTSPHGGMGFSQLMHTADDTNLPAVPENEAMESFEMFGSNTNSGGGGGEDQQDAALILPGAHQIPNYSPHSTNHPQQQQEESNQWFFNLLSAARRRSSSSQSTIPSNQITILDASTSRLNTPLIATPPTAPFLGGMDRARARVMASLEDSDSFQVAMSFNNHAAGKQQQQQQQQQCTVDDIMNIVSNPTNLQLWYDPIQTVVVTSRSSDEDGLGGSGRSSGGSNGSSSSDHGRQYEGEWIEASTTALESPPCIVGPLYELESTLRGSLGVGSYGKITIFAEKTHGKVTLTVGPFPGGIHVRHTISVISEEEQQQRNGGGRGGGGVKIVDRVKLEMREEDASSFQSTLSLGGMLNSCLLPPLASYMEQVKNSMAKLLLLIESGQVSRSGGGGGGGAMMMMPPLMS